MQEEELTDEGMIARIQWGFPGPFPGDVLPGIRLHKRRLRVKMSLCVNKKKRMKW